MTSAVKDLSDVSGEHIGVRRDGVEMEVDRTMDTCALTPTHHVPHTFNFSGFPNFVVTRQIMFTFHSSPDHKFPHGHT